MLKYAKIINNNSKECEVGLGTDSKYYESLGMTLLDVEKCDWKGGWYLKGYVPAKPEPTLEEQLIDLEQKYNMPRVIREGILGNPTAYSEFNVNRARDLEDLAKKVRDLKEGK